MQCGASPPHPETGSLKRPLGWKYDRLRRGVMSTGAGKNPHRRRFSPAPDPPPISSSGRSSRSASEKLPPETRAHARLPRKKRRRPVKGGVVGDQFTRRGDDLLLRLRALLGVVGLLRLVGLLGFLSFFCLFGLLGFVRFLRVGLGGKLFLVLLVVLFRLFLLTFVLLLVFLVRLL